MKVSALSPYIYGEIKMSGFWKLCEGVGNNVVKLWKSHWGISQRWSFIIVLSYRNATETKYLIPVMILLIHCQIGREFIMIWCEIGVHYVRNIARHTVADWLNFLHSFIFSEAGVWVPFCVRMKNSKFWNNEFDRCSCFEIKLVWLQ